MVMGAFNEASVIGEVVRELRVHHGQVVVVDDGSGDQTALRGAEAGAVVLRHVINRGQGAALQTGFTYCLRHGAQFILTFDADGQHSVTDVDRLLGPLLRGEADVAFGSRFLGEAPGMPRRRRILLKLGVLFTRLASGARLTDTHNGIRAFTREAASRIRISEDRMAHASELIDQVVANDLRYLEVPVTIRYTGYSMAKGQKASGSFGIVLNYLFRKLLGPA